jgi:hypothetical protein
VKVDPKVGSPGLAAEAQRVEQQVGGRVDAGGFLQHVAKVAVVVDVRLVERTRQVETRNSAEALAEMFLDAVLVGAERFPLRISRSARS